MISKDTITQVYHDLVIDKKTTKITVKEICQQCHISRTTFYKYFKDAYDILEYIFVNDAMEPLKNLIKETSLDSKLITVNWYLSFYKHRTFYLIAIHDEGQNSLFDTIINRLENFNLSLYENNGNTTQDIEYIAYKQATMQAMLLKKWMKEGMVVSPEKMAEYFLHDVNSGHI